MTPSRIGFYAHHRFHRSILEPVQAALPAACESLLSGDARRVVAFRPHVLLLAAHDRLEYFRHRLPGTLIGNARHGLVTKTVLLRTPSRPAARAYDFLCTGPDDVATDAYRRAGAAPGEVWRTGYPQLDPLHRRDAVSLPGLRAGRPTILYAPTWNLGLSSAPMLGTRVVELVRCGAPDANVIIKPHPVIGEWRPGWMRAWRRAADGAEGVLLVGDTHADVTPYLLSADVLVSDASSVIFAFLALDRPIVLVTNPLHRADLAYEPDDMVWSRRAVGVEVHAAEELPEAIADALARPGARQAERAACARMLFGEQIDGRNAERIAHRLAQRATAAAAASGSAPPVRSGWTLAGWVVGDRLRAARDRPAIRRLVGPVERLRLGHRQRLLMRGRLRTPDGRRLEPPPRAAGAA